MEPVALTIISSIRSNALKQYINVKCHTLLCNSGAKANELNCHARFRVYPTRCTYMCWIYPEPCVIIQTLCEYFGRLFDRVDLIKPVSNVRPFVRPYIHTHLRTKVLSNLARRRCDGEWLSEWWVAVMIVFGCVWRYLEEAVLRLNCRNRFTAEHFPLVLGQLLHSVEVMTSSVTSSAESRRQMRMISLTARSLLASKPWSRHSCQLYTVAQKNPRRCIMSSQKLVPNILQDRCGDMFKEWWDLLGRLSQIWSWLSW